MKLGIQLQTLLVAYFDYDFLSDLQLDESGSLSKIFIMCWLCQMFWEQTGQTTALGRKLLVVVVSLELEITPALKE